MTAARARLAGARGAQVRRGRVRQIAGDRDVADVEPVPVRARDQPGESHQALVEEDAQPLAGQTHAAQGTGLRAHPALDLLRVRGPEHRGAARRLELGLVELVVSANDGDHRLVVPT